jgi:hypothetical protein
MSSSPSDERKPRFRSRLAVVTAATTITAVLVAASGVLQASAAAPATRGDMHVTRGAPSTLAKLRPRPSVTPKPSVTPTPSASPTPTPTASPAQTATTAPSPTVTASTTASPSGCTVLIFNAQSYCAGTLTGVNRTAYGLGQRIALGGVNVSVVNDQNNTVQVWGFDPCPPGNLCGAGSATTTLVWDGSPKPVPGDVISVYGVTITSSLRIDGYVKIGWCHPEWGC